MPRHNPLTTIFLEFSWVLDWLSSVDANNPRTTGVTRLVYLEPNAKDYFVFTTRSVFRTAAATFISKLGRVLAHFSNHSLQNEVATGHMIMAELERCRDGLLAYGESAFSDLEFKFDAKLRIITIVFRMGGFPTGAAYSVEFPAFLTAAQIYAVYSVAVNAANTDY